MEEFNMAFERRIDEKIIQNLLDTDTDVGRIFTSLLRPSIMAGQLFMAIKVDRVDYYVGANRFMESSGKSFKINPKMYGKSSKSKMITIDRVFGRGWESDFGSLVNQCSNYSTSKRFPGERKIMQAYFPVYDSDDRVIVLDQDIHINDKTGKKCNWLLYDTVSKCLKFVDVKTSNHKDLKKNRDGLFKAIDQLDGYSAQYHRNKAVIVEQYQNYVKIINKLLEIHLPLPERLDTITGLAIFEENYKIDEDLIKMMNPYVGRYRPAISASTEEMWQHFKE